jgi:hypothetical protein
MTTLDPLGPRVARHRPHPVPRWFRVEHRDALGSHDLGQVCDVAPTHHSLTPFLAHLLFAGAIGEVVLIDATSGSEVARRFLTDPRRRGTP